MLLMDVDGVMTDGRLYNVPDAQGKWSKPKGFDSQDGIGLQWMCWNNIKTGLISGRVSPATDERAKQCKFCVCLSRTYRKNPDSRRDPGRCEDRPAAGGLYRRRPDGHRRHAPGRTVIRDRECPRRGEARRALHHASARRLGGRPRGLRVHPEGQKPLGAPARESTKFSYKPWRIESGSSFMPSGVLAFCTRSPE